MAIRSGPVDRFMNAFEAVMIAGLATAALAVGSMQVILRYVFNTGFPWSEGIFITLTIWAVFLGGSRAVRDKIHIRVDFFVMVLPKCLRKPIGLAGDVLSLGLSLFFAYCGFLYTQFLWQMDVVSTDAYIPEWIIFAIIPLAMTAFSIRYLQIIWRRLRDGAGDDLAEEATTVAYHD